MVHFRLIRTPKQIAQTLKGLEANMATLLLEKSSFGDKLFVLNTRGEIIGVAEGAAVNGFKAFMAANANDDGLLPKFSQSFGTARPR